MNDPTQPYAQSSQMMAGGDVFTVSVSGDIAGFVQFKERLCATINGTVAPYALFADGQQRFVAFRIEMLPDRPSPSWLLVGTAAKKQAAWLSVIGPPLLRIYWLSISDTDAVKWETLKSRLEAWLDVVIPASSPGTVDSSGNSARPVDLAALVILHIEPQAHIGSITSVSRVQQQLSDKIRALNSPSNANRNVHCFSFQPFNKTEFDPAAIDRLSASLHSLLAIQAIERVRRIEEIARVERERCCRAAMAATPLKGITDERLYFANMFLLEEAVARGYAALSLFDDALARLDLVDAVLSQSAANCFCQSGRPLAVWIDECLAHPPTHVDCMRLVPAVENDWPTSPCPLMLLETGRHPLLETRAELLARQAAVVFRMASAHEGIPGRLTPAAAANKLATYALQVAHSVVVESRQLSIGGPLPKLNNPPLQSINDAFVFLLFCEAAAACQVLVSSAAPLSPALHSPMNLNVMGHQALWCLKRLGQRSGFLAGSLASSPTESESLHATISILQLLRFRSPASGGSRSSASGSDIPTRPETHSDKLARLLTASTPDNFVLALIELAESLLATLKSSGFRRWARHIAYELADIYLLAARHDCKLPFSLTAAAEPLLLDCIGAWLTSRCTDLATASLKLLVENCYPITTMNEPQQARRRLWALLHLKAYSNVDADDEIVALNRQISELKTRPALLSGNFLFSCSGISLVSVKSAYKAVITLKLQSSFPNAVKECSVEMVVRIASVIQPSSYFGRRSFDSFGDDDHLENGGHVTLPPFRPEVTAAASAFTEASSREHDQVLILKTPSPITLKPNADNEIEFKLDIPNGPDYEAGALIYYVRASVNLNSAVNLLCGLSVKSLRPLVFRPPDDSTRDTTGLKEAPIEEKLCEISLDGGNNNNKPTLTNGNSFSNNNNDTCDAGASLSLAIPSGNKSAAFGAEFALEPVFVGGTTVIFVIVDIMQRVLVADEAESGKRLLPRLVDPVIAVELDGEDALMLDRPIFDFSNSQSIVIPLVAAKDQPVLPMILARLIWRLPTSIPPTTKQIRLLLSATVNDSDNLSDVDSEDRLTIASNHFDFMLLSSNKLLPAAGPSTASSRETYM